MASNVHQMLSTVLDDPEESPARDVPVDDAGAAELLSKLQGL